MGKEVNFEGTMELKNLIVYLEDLLAGYRAGKICVQQGEEFVTLTPGDMVDVEIEAEQKEDAEKIAIKLSWKKRDAIKEIPSLRFSTSEPVIRSEKAEKSDKEDGKHYSEKHGKNHEKNPNEKHKLEKNRR